MRKSWLFDHLAEVGLIVLLSLTGFSVWQGQVSTKLHELSESETQILQYLERAHLNIREAEASGRGYAYARSQNFVSEFERALESYQRQIGAAQELLQKHPDLAVTLEPIKAAGQKKIDYMRQNMTLIHARSDAELLIRSRSGQGIQLMSEFRREVENINQRLREDSRGQQAQVLISGRIMIAFAIFAALIGAFLILHSKRSLKRARRIAEDWAQETERKSIELITAREAAQLASESKSRFLSYMSHEIRTPLNAIGGFTRLLQRVSLTPDAKNLVEGIDTASKSLLGLLNEVIDLSRIESRAKSANATSTSLDELMKTVISIFEGHARLKGLRLHLGVPVGLPNFLVDGQLLRQLLMNLMSNAVKLTGSGSVELRVEVLNQNSPQWRLRFAVVDTGPGIDPEKASQLFQEFTMAHEETGASSARSSSGLGLMICKQIESILNGNLYFESELNKGTTFFFELTLMASEQAAESKDLNSVASFDRPSRKDQRVALLVDDNEMNLTILKGVLENEGWQVKMALDGRQACDEVSRSDFDVILMDCQMPQMDGFEASGVIRRMCSETQRPQPYIIALTAHALIGYKEKCLNAGMNNYLTKPIDFDLLLKMMTGEVSIQPLETDVFEAKVWERAKRLKTPNGNLLSDLSEMILQSFPLKIDSMANALSRRDFATLGQVAHHLRSSFGTIGAKRALVHLRVIDDLCEAEVLSDQNEKTLESEIQALKNEWSLIKPMLELQRSEVCQESH